MSSHLWSGSFVVTVALAATAAWSETAFAQPRRVKAKGQVVAVAGNLVTLVDEGKNRHQVRPKAENGQVEISGPWEADKLQPGMVIRLSGVVKSNEIQDELTELVVHSPADLYQLGIENGTADQPATILGEFVRIKDGKLTISVGKRRISAKLAKEVAINIQSKDLRFVTAGDAIDIDSYTTNSGVLSGRTIKVTIQPKKSPNEPK